jgi:hypothetical protein
MKQLREAVVEPPVSRGCGHRVGAEWVIAVGVLSRGLLRESGLSSL